MHEPGPPPTSALPRIEAELGLRDYQRRALRAFVDAGGRGIAHMATGTGKTRLGIAAIAWAREAGLRALILVPTHALLAQWRHEVLTLTDLDHSDVLAVAGSRRLRRPHAAQVLLTPIQTAMRNPDALTRMARERQRHLLIVDECHRAGAPRYARALVEAFPYRFGLSATPERPWDPVGTRRVLDYFEGITNTYDLGTAVDAGHLARYTYHLHSTYLTGPEQVGHNHLSDEIKARIDSIESHWPETADMPDLGHVFAFLRSIGEQERVEDLQRLLFERARIVKNAIGKLDVFGELCPQLTQKKTIVFAEEIDFAEALGDVARGHGLPTMLYHSHMTKRQRDEVLERYRKTERAVLLAVRALDEGLDVPDADVAILAASSTSARQHIQRRGRVLRPLRDRDKQAELHDFFVIGVDDARRVERIKEDATNVLYHGFEANEAIDAQDGFQDPVWENLPW